MGAKTQFPQAPTGKSQERPFHILQCPCDIWLESVVPLVIRDGEELEQVKVDTPRHLCRINRSHKDIITIRRRTRRERRLVVFPCASNARDRNSLSPENCSRCHRLQFHRHVSSVGTLDPEVACVCVFLDGDTPVAGVGKSNLAGGAGGHIDAHDFGEGRGERVGGVDGEGDAADGGVGSEIGRGALETVVAEELSVDTTVTGVVDILWFVSMLNDKWESSGGGRLTSNMNP